MILIYHLLSTPAWYIFTLRIAVKVIWFMPFLFQWMRPYVELLVEYIIEIGFIFHQATILKTKEICGPTNDTGAFQHMKLFFRIMLVIQL